MFLIHNMKNVLHKRAEDERQTWQRSVPGAGSCHAPSAGDLRHLAPHQLQDPSGEDFVVGGVVTQLPLRAIPKSKKAPILLRRGQRFMYNLWRSSVEAVMEAWAAKPKRDGDGPQARTATKLWEHVMLSNFSSVKTTP